MGLKKFSTLIKDFGGTICPTYSDPLDPRIVVEFESDLWEHASETFGSITEKYCKVYQGMLVYVEETKTTYEYVGPIEEGSGITIADANHRKNWRAVSTPGTDANVVITTLVADDGSEVTPEAYLHKSDNDNVISSDKNKLYILSRDAHTKKDGSRYDYSHDGWIETSTEDSTDGATHNALIIRHSDVLRTDTQDAIQKEIDVELKFPFVDEIETDEKGHIIGVNTKTVSWDPEKNYAYKYIKVDDTCPEERIDATPDVEVYDGENNINKSLPEANVPTKSVKSELTADSETDTLTFIDDRWIHIEASKDGEDDTISITHEDVERKDEKVSQHKSVDEKITFEVVDEIKTDSKGHITGVRTNTFDWTPSDNYAFKTINVNDTHPTDRIDESPEVKTYDGTKAIEKSIPEANVPTNVVSTSLVADSETDTLTFVDDRWIHIGAIPSSDTITIQHEDVERKDEDVTQEKKIDEWVKFKMIDEVISDEKGHITGIRTNTFEWNPEHNYAFQTIKVEDEVAGERTDADPGEKTYNGQTPIEKSVPTAQVATSIDKTELTSDSEDDTLTFKDDRWISVKASQTDQSLTITHEDVKRKDVEVSQDKSVDEKLTFNIVDEVVSDAKGHVTGVRTNTFTWDPSKNYAFKTIQAITSNVQDRTDNYQDVTSKNILDAVSTTSDSTTTLVADSETDTLTFKDDKYISIVADPNSDTLTFSHENVERHDGTTTLTKETDKDLSVEIIDLVVTDAKGHVTGVRTNTLSIPRNTNFGYKKFEVGGNSVVTNTNKDYVNTGSSIADHEDDTMKIQGDTWMNVTIADDQINLSHGVSSNSYNQDATKQTDGTYAYNKTGEKPSIYTSSVANPADTIDLNNRKILSSITTDDANHVISSIYRTDIPTKVWVQWEIENALKSTDAMVFKGGFNPNTDTLPTSTDGRVQAGYTYKITANGKITIGSEVRDCVVGDTLICTKDNPSSADWMVLETRNDLATKDVPGNVIIGDGIAVDTSGEISLDVINYGSGINPVYINSDKQIVSSTSTVGSSIKPIYLNNGTITESNSTVGSSIKPMYLNNGTLTASSETVGSSIKPMYLNNGALTASSETVGSGIKPLYLSNGTLTASTSTVGSGIKPIYLTSGTLTESTSTIGSDIVPMHLEDGTLTASTTTVGSGIIPIYMDKGSLTASTLTVGSGIKPMYLNSGTLTESTSTVGSTTKPLYLNSGTLSECTYSLNSTIDSGSANRLAYYKGANEIDDYSGNNGGTAANNIISLWGLISGVPTNSTATVGGTAKPVYVNAGTITACSDTVGSNAANGGTPVYMNAGTITALTNINSGLLSNLGNGLKIDNGKLSFDVSTNGISVKTTTANGVDSYTINFGSTSATITAKDTKNTAGATDKKATKLFLVGAGDQGTNPLSYSNGNVYIDTDNCVYAPTYYATSDMRYKTVLNDLKLTVDQIAQLPTFDFEWKDGSGKSTGTSAQAVKEILPNLVSGEDKLTLNYGALGVVEGIILARKVVDLENKIIELENKLNKYENGKV